MLMVRTDLLRRGETLADLRGKTITDGSADGFIAQMVLYRALGKGGLSVKDVNAIFVGFNEAIAASEHLSRSASLLPV
jgi:ABC-type nitrate/sulfonate/bicarbonate transport system substrate-binding protein